MMTLSMNSTCGNYSAADAGKAYIRNTAMYLLTGMFIIATLVLAVRFMGTVLPVMAHAASGSSAASTAMDTVKQISQIIASITGIIFLVVGLIKFGIAWSQGDGPSEGKAGAMLASGVGLIVIANIVIAKIDLTSFIVGI